MCLAVPGKLIDKEKGIVDFNGIKRKTNLDFVEDVQVGDFLLVHAGFAIQKIDKKKAEKNWDLLK